MVLRYGYCLPSSQAFCSVAFMEGVVARTLYCPRYADVRLRPCPLPPPKDLLLAEVNGLLADRQLTLGDTTKVSPDRKWLMMVLATLAPGHPFFSKGYRPPSRPMKEKKINPPTLPADFFTGQPPPTAKTVKRSSKKTANMMYKCQQKRMGRSVSANQPAADVVMSMGGAQAQLAGQSQ